LQHQHHSQDFWLCKKPVLTKCSQYPASEGKQHQSAMPIGERRLTPEAPNQDQDTGQEVGNEGDEETSAEKPVDQKQVQSASLYKIAIIYA
jgi:hypothetical protein